MSSEKKQADTDEAAGATEAAAPSRTLTVLVTKFKDEFTHYTSTHDKVVVTSHKVEGDVIGLRVQSAIYLVGKNAGTKRHSLSQGFMSLLDEFTAEQIEEVLLAKRQVKTLEDVLANCDAPDDGLESSMRTLSLAVADDAGSDDGQVAVAAAAAADPFKTPAKKKTGATETPTPASEKRSGNLISRTKSVFGERQTAFEARVERISAFSADLEMLEGLTDNISIYYLIDKVRTLWSQSGPVEFYCTRITRCMPVRVLISDVDLQRVNYIDVKYLRDYNI